MEYMTKGVCSKKLNYEIRDGKICDIRFTGGCDGNLKGIAKLAEGMTPDEVIEKLRGIDCGGKGTSCPAQLAQALQLEKNNSRTAN